MTRQPTPADVPGLELDALDVRIDPVGLRAVARIIFDGGVDLDDMGEEAARLLLRAYFGAATAQAAASDAPPAVTNDDVDGAWAEIVGPDIARDCHQVNIVRGDLRSALEWFASGKSIWASRNSTTSQTAASDAGADAVAVLRGVEWNGHNWGFIACPSCGAAKQYGRHAPDCRLAKAIAAQPGPEGQPVTITYTNCDTGADHG